MAKVTGIGGVFFKCQDLEHTKDWYRDLLGIPLQDAYGAAFPFREDDRPEIRGYSVFGPFGSRTRYFEPSDRGFMINLRVDDLDGVLIKLRSAGARIVGNIETHDYGRFAWVIDPEGVKLELWEPSGDIPPDIKP
jgi:predicted enzyme related to lactoylglutathione lyase